MNHPVNGRRLALWAAGLGALWACSDGGALLWPLGAGERTLQEDWCGPPEADPADQFLPLDDSFHLLPPEGSSSTRTRDFDDTLTGSLRVVVCRASSPDPCVPVAEVTAATAPRERGLGALFLQDDQYHANLRVERGLVGEELAMQFFVGELRLSTHAFVPRNHGVVPLKFRVFDNPLIRVEVLRQQDLDAAQIGHLLAEEFALSGGELGWVLRAHGYGPADVYLALTEGMGLTDAAEIEAIFDSLCVPEDQYLPLTARYLVERFAPVLRFDKAYKGLPMSADVYFNAVMTPSIDEAKGKISWTTPWNGPPLGSYWDSTSEMYWAVISVCGRDECNHGMSNQDFATLDDGKVPTYFTVVSDRQALNQGRLRIAYWWFYGFQYPCNDGAGAVSDDGAHHGDWEHVVVTTVPGREQIAAVTYFFHGDWYTRRAGGFETQGDRPVVYVGKTAHGSYHSRDHSGWMVGTPSHCCEFADYRNPEAHSIWSNVQDNLVSLSIGTESWLRADRPGELHEHEGRTYEVGGWSWGPHISHCEFDFLGCWDWDHVSACATHPSGEVLDWSFASCDEEGCDGYTFVCAYSADYDQGWP